MLPRKSTVIAGPSFRYGVALVACVVAAGCNRAPEVWHGEHRFDELLHAPGAIAASTAGSAWVAIDNDSRAVIARPIPIVHAEGLRIEQPGVQSYRAHGLDGISEPLPTVEAMVRAAGGEWQARSVRTEGSATVRFLAVAFTAADTSQPVDLVINAWLPPLPLDVTSDPFRVPSRARLRFGTGVRSDVPVQGHFRVSVQPEAGTPVVLSDTVADSAGARRAVGWREVAADLQAYAGQQVRLHFEASLSSSLPLDDAPFPPPRAVISAPLLVTEQTGHEPACNLIIVSIDTLRADHVGAYGYRRPISPTIDRLAAAGTLFEHVFAVWPETSASHMTLFTSLYPSVHGIGISKWGAATLPGWQLTLGEWLRQHGFITAAVTEDGLLAAEAGFPRGFDAYRELPPILSAGSVIGTNPIDGMPMARRRLGAVTEGVGHATDWLRQHRDDRFFLFLHTYQVHQRMAPGPTYDALRARFVHDGVSPEITDANNYLATYDAAIAYTDDALRTLIATLEELQLTGRTLLVVTSDHGEAFYEHGQFGHNHSLHDEELRVPLVLYCPGTIAAGRRVATQIGLIDLAPTLLDLLHLPALPQAEGHSAGDLMSGSNTISRPPLIGELADRHRAVRSDAWKLTRSNTTSGIELQFYDLRKDPGEHSPLPVSESPDAQNALPLLTQHDVDSQAWRLQLQQLAGTTAPAATPQLDAETRERMRALGYEVPGGDD